MKKKLIMDLYLECIFNTKYEELWLALIDISRFSRLLSAYTFIK